MRADRLIAVLLLMQARGQVTAAQVATELEISLATARRDLRALADAGVPVYPQPGRGGGWSLVGGARTDLSGLTAEESRALFLHLGHSASASPRIASAVRKLLRALPSTFRDEALTAATAIRRDGTRWGDAAGERPPEVAVLEQAVVTRVQVGIDYVNRAGEAGSRLVTPLGLVVKDRVWYLVAKPEGLDDTRTYRVDRMTSVELTDRPGAACEGFDLAAQWRRVVEYVEDRRSLVAATVLVEQHRLPVLRDRFGRYLTETGRRRDGRVEATVAAHSARALAEQLAGWCGVLTVAGPAVVREELARIGAELVAAYS